MVTAMNKENNCNIPSYDVVFWDNKKNNTCVIIPVINEGQRIINLLEKMQSCDIARNADIIIIDGGSTDGSLEVKNLLGHDVTGLLVKTASGKLSAQLRCAYGFALQHGYKNIITIDGNDKDDPSSIPQFISKLNEGYDFIQASRFIPGGIAVNTPKSRDLAIKLIHAPMLSLFSGFHWTDTTQGFRGYSSKLLSDPNVAIFRDVFDSYELLAYLSYIAPKLGFKCIELPTSRIYPNGEVPTKISSIKGNFAVLKTLFKTCFGAYNNK